MLFNSKLRLDELFLDKPKYFNLFEIPPVSAKKKTHFAILLRNFLDFLATFSKVFGGFLKFSEVFGRVWMRSDAFGCFRMLGWSPKTPKN